MRWKIETKSRKKSPVERSQGMRMSNWNRISFERQQQNVEQNEYISIFCGTINAESFFRSFRYWYFFFLHFNSFCVRLCFWEISILFFPYTFSILFYGICNVFLVICVAFGPLMLAAVLFEYVEIPSTISYYIHTPGIRSFCCTIIALLLPFILSFSRCTAFFLFSFLLCLHHFPLLFIFLGLLLFTMLASDHIFLFPMLFWTSFFHLFSCVASYLYVENGARCFLFVRSILIPFFPTFAISLFSQFKSKSIFLWFWMIIRVLFFYLTAATEEQF